MKENSDTFSTLKITTATNIFITFLGIATGILTPRLLGPIGEGQLAAIQTWSLILASFAQLGLPEALVYLLSRDSENGLQYVLTAELLAFSSSIVMFIIGWFVLPIFLHSQSNSIIDAARVFLVVTFIYALFGLPHGALRGIQSFKLWNILRIVPSTLWLLVVAGFMAFNLKQPIDLSRTFLIINAISGILLISIVYKRINGRARVELKYIGKLIKFGIPSVMTSIPQTLNLRLDQFFIIALLPAKYLGYYVVAVAWSGGISPIISGVGSIMFPKISADKDKHDIRFLKTGLQGGLLVGSIVGAILTLIAPIAIPIVFGNDFRNSIAPALFLVPSGVILAWAGIAEESLRGLGRPTVVLVAESIGAITTVISLIILLHLFGIVGAAISSLIGYTIVATVCVIAISKSTHTPIVAFVLPDSYTLKWISRNTMKLTKKLLKGLQA